MMPLFPILRFIFALLSIAVLAAGGYLLWTWYEGHITYDPIGRAYLNRDEWRLWTAVPLLAWSFLGHSVISWLITQRDKVPSSAKLRVGSTVESPTGARLNVNAYGPKDAPVIILTHGWSCDSSFWYYAVARLSRRFRVFTWDLPGLGLSMRPAGGKVCLNNFGQDLAAVIRFSGSERITLVGHSIGGMVIQTLARDSREMFLNRVAGVVLLHTTYTNPLRTMILSGLARAIRWPILEPTFRLSIPLTPLVWLSSWQSYLSGSKDLALRLGFGKWVTRSQLNHAALMMTRNSPAVSSRGDLAMFRWDSEEALEGMATPLLVVGGNADIVTKPSASRHIAASVPGSQLEIVDGGNHMTPLELADDYSARIERFVTASSA